MVELLASLFAVVIAATVLWLSVRGVEALLPIIIANANWFVAASYLLAFAVVIIALVKEQRSKPDEA